MENEQDRKISISVDIVDSDTRIDLFLASHINEFTRSRIQTLIKQGNVKVNHNAIKASHRLKAGDEISIFVPHSSPYLLKPEKIDLSIIYEDSSIIVLDKPPGLVVHPAPGHRSGTLVHGLLHHCNDLSGIGGVLRPGIVHRLDKDTSGLLVVAKNDKAHNSLSGQFKDGKVNKRYIALVHGIPKIKEGKIELPISRHPVKRKEMAVSQLKGKNALTLWKIQDVIGDKFTLLSVIIKTGRTHQIRVHMSHIGHPVVGDSVYGYKKNWWNKNTNYPMEISALIKRQMLHAEYLGFFHPDTKEYIEFKSQIPEDINLVLKNLMFS